MDKIGDVAKEPTWLIIYFIKDIYSYEIEVQKQITALKKVRYKKGVDFFVLLDKFSIDEDCLTCVENNINLHPDDFEIDEVHRFEGPTDPGDENILLAISSEKYKIKGLLVNAFGMYSDSFSAKLLSKLNKK